MNPIVVSYDLAAEDQLAAVMYQRRQQFVAAHPPRPGWWATVFCLAVSLVVASFVFQFSLAVVASRGLLLLLGAGAAVFGWGRLRRRQQLAQLKANPATQLDQRREVRLLPSGLCVTSPAGESSTTAWRDVTSCSSFQNYLVVSGKGGSICLIPRRAFPSVGEAARFAATVEHYVQAAGTVDAAPLPATFPVLGHDRARPTTESDAVRSYAERIRQQRAEDEARLQRSMLWLTLVYAVAAAAGWVVLRTAPAQATWQTMVYVIVMTAAAGAGCVASWGVSRLAHWSRRPVLALAGFGLLLFPFGTVFGFQILRLVCTGTPPRLLSPDYQWLVRQTPTGLANRVRRVGSFVWLTWLLVVLILGLALLISQLPPASRPPVS